MPSCMSRPCWEEGGPTRWVVQKAAFSHAELKPQLTPHMLTPCVRALSDLLLYRSCVETMKIADETLDALFDMELPLPRPVVRSLAEGIDTILQKCALHSGSVRKGPYA